MHSPASVKTHRSGEGELYCVQILLIKKQDASGSCEEEGWEGNGESETSWGHRDALGESGWVWLGGGRGDMCMSSGC